LYSYLYIQHSLSAYWHSLYSYLYIQHSLSAYWHSHCIPTCTFNIPCQHTDTLIVFLPVHSTFLISILTLSLYSYLYIQHSLSAYWHSHCIPTYLENTEENCEMIWEIWKKSQLKSEKIWKKWKKSKLKSDRIWKVWKKNKLNSAKIWKIWKKSQLKKWNDLENMEER
jgi:hypothetical protein